MEPSPCADFLFNQMEALAQLSFENDRPQNLQSSDAGLPGSSNCTSSTYEYDTVDLLEMTAHPDETFFSYPCPCGDIFAVTHDELIDYEDIAHCASCSLLLRVTDSSGIVDMLRKEATGV